jgi:AcrR family transcriptional regulator
MTYTVSVYDIHSFNVVKVPFEEGDLASKKKRTAKRELTHSDIVQASVRIDPDLRRRSQLLWDDRSPSTRGPKAALTPDDVVRAAVEIADGDGLAAVTMNAVATKVGLTTMAIYRYFPNKETLIDAIVDAGMGRPPRSERRGSWRVEVARWARAKRAMLIARPWLAELPFVAAPHGPNWLAWLEALADALSDIGLDGPDIGQMLSIIDAYTRGASDTAISLARSRARGSSDEEWTAAVGADLGRAIGDSRFPKFAAMLTAPITKKPPTLEESFDFGLQRVLDGIELYLERE